MAKKLMEKGFTDVKILKGGWKEWIDGKLPIEAK
ncbi:MAG: rhodanese-like domain-containing protein [Proteobacteria bacterium]|nr:rhodanese-like domain-containing protein [Pseudomonadota bacterium]